MNTKMLAFFIGAGTILMAMLIEIAARGRFGAGAVPGADVEPPGVGIPALAGIDAVLLHSLILMSIEFFPRIGEVFSRFQALVTLVFGIIGAILLFVLIMATIQLLMLMVALLTGGPFGLIVYLAVWGTFETGDARLILNLVMFLKLVGVGFLLFSSPGLLRNRRFVILLVCSIGLTFILGFLHGFPPFFLVSIADAIGALIAAVVALFWMLLVLIGALMAIVRFARGVAPV